MGSTGNGCDFYEGIDYAEPASLVKSDFTSSAMWTGMLLATGAFTVAYRRNVKLQREWTIPP